MTVPSITALLSIHATKWREYAVNYGVPLILGLALTFCKIMADGKKLKNEEANGVALDMVLISIGTFVVILKGRSTDDIMLALAGNALVALILLIVRYSRSSKGAAATPTSNLSAAIQIILGLGSFVWTLIV